MKRVSKIGVSGGLLLGAFVAVHTTASDAGAAEVLSLSPVRVVYEHTSFNGVVPGIFSPPHSSLDDSAYYSLRGLSINPTGGSTGGASIYTSWLHGFGSRWVLEYDLDVLDPPAPLLVSAVASPDPTHAARLFSDFTTRQSQPKSVAIDDRGNVYTPIRNGASGSPDPISEVFVYGPDLNGAGPSFPDADIPTRGLIDIDATFSSPQFLAEGVATDGNQWLYVTTRKGGFGQIVRYDISDAATTVGGPTIAHPPVLDTAFGTSDGSPGGVPDGILNISNSGSLRGVAVGADGTVYLADKASEALFSVDPITEAVAFVSMFPLRPTPLEASRPHHLTVFDFGGTEYIAVTDQEFRLFIVESANFLDNSAYQVVDLSGMVSSDALTTGFGQIDYFDGTLYWTLEDVSTVRVGGLDMVTDQILAIDVIGLITGVASGLDAVSVIPEPGTLSALSVGLLLAARRRRSIRG